MGKPAARMGDMTAHGGTIVAGCPTVLIGGQPAARMGDMHVCPLLNPGLPPPPHVGGPVSMGSPLVLIGGQPAARMGDMLVCAGPPDVIVGGCPTVLIGEAGGAGGGPGAGAAALARGAAAASITGVPGPEATGPHWLEIQFVDSAGNPVTGVPYELEHVDGHREQGVLTGDGCIRRGGLPEGGEYTVRLFDIYNARWSQEEARVGDTVKLLVDVVGFEDGTEAVLEIYKKDILGPDVHIDRLKTKVQRGRIEVEWVYRLDEVDDDAPESPADYSYPEYYFVARVGPCQTRSGILYFQDWIEIHLTDFEGKPIPEEEYRLILSTGEVRKGRVDREGKARVEDVPPGIHRVEFPRIKIQRKRGDSNGQWADNTPREGQIPSDESGSV